MSRTGPAQVELSDEETRCALGKEERGKTILGWSQQQFIRLAMQGLIDDAGLKVKVGIVAR